jgi:arylsulfatase
MTPFRGENTNWEGAYCVPMIVRWPGRIQAGVVSNEIVQHHDRMQTFLAIAGEPAIAEELKPGTALHALSRAAGAGALRSRGRV